MSAAARILLVDDDIDFVEAVTMTLEAAGHTVLTAHTAAEGLKLVRERPVDLAIIDMMMEEQDAGAMLADGLRRQPELQEIPILLVTGVTAETGYTVPREVPREDWLKVDVWLDKPVEPAELLRIVQATVTKSCAGTAV